MLLEDTETIELALEAALQTQKKWVSQGYTPRPPLQLPAPRFLMYVTRNSNHSNIHTIVIGKTSYIIKDKLFYHQSLIGHGMRIWLVYLSDKPEVQVIIKDSFVLTNSTRESNFIKLMPSSIRNILQVIDEWVGPKTTLFARPGLPHDVEDRQKRRLVITPCGKPLDTWTSLMEICSFGFDTAMGKFQFICDRFVLSTLI